MTLQPSSYGWRGGRSIAAFSLMAALAACEGPAGPTGAPGAPGQVGGLDPALGTTDKAFAGVGGKAALDALTSFTIESTGNRLMIGEGFAPEDGSGDVSVFALTVNHDVAGDALRLDYHREFFFIPGERDFSEVIAGNVGYVEGSDNIFLPPADPPVQIAMTSDRMAAIRKEQRLLSPQLILRDIAADPSIAAAGGHALLDGSVHELLVVDDAVAPITLYVNAATGRIAKLETVENDPLRRDVPIEVFYADWRGEAGQVQFPYALFLAVDGNLIHAETRTSVTVNGAIDAAQLAIPGALAPAFVQADADRGMRSHQSLHQFASLGIRLEGPLQENVVATPLDTDDAATAKVFFLAGGSHNSLAIKQEGGVILAEAPLYPERSRAILGWVETQFGAGTKVTHVIATHHHADHAAGLRELVAAGATVVLQENARAFFADIFHAPSTISPDSLAQNPTAAAIQTVGNDDSITLADTAADGPIDVQAYHVRTTHAKDMLVIYVPVPQNEIVFVSDIYSPGLNLGGPGAAELHGALTDAYGLTVATIAGGHGGTGPFSDLENLVNGN